jgi:hypothetical protein
MSALTRFKPAHIHAIERVIEFAENPPTTYDATYDMQQTILRVRDALALLRVIFRVAG